MAANKPQGGANSWGNTVIKVRSPRDKPASPGRDKPGSPRGLLPALRDAAVDAAVDHAIASECKGTADTMPFDIVCVGLDSRFIEVHAVIGAAVRKNNAEWMYELEAAESSSALGPYSSAWALIREGRVADALRTLDAW